MTDGETKREEPDDAVSRQQALAVGSRLRQTRQNAGLSLADVALATGLSRGFISKCERGLSVASLATLLRWTASLGIGVGAVFENVDSPARRGNRKPYHYARGITEYLLSSADEGRFQAFEEHIEPGASPDRRYWSVNADVALVYVISGSLEMYFDLGERVVVLEAGETLTYSPREPHRWINPSRSFPAEIIIFNMPASF